jgi:peptidoglycan/xylan/chitin deacetylase (PgdA/CDA1 family)
MPRSAADLSPELSVVIPTRNRSRQLRACLASLETQTAAAGEFEVVVVDDGSTDETRSLLSSLKPRFALTVVEASGAGVSAARNAGAARAAGAVLLFLDDDEEADPGLVSGHLALHRRERGVAGQGAIARRVPDGADPYARMQAQEGNERIHELAGRPLTYWDCCAGNLSVAREVFDAVGGFATDMPRENDTELAYRLHAAGVRFVFLPDARATELRTRPWRGVLADTRTRGRVAVELYRRHPAMIERMPLGRYGELPRTRSGQLVVRTALLFRVPTTFVGLAGLALPKPGWRQVWLFSIALPHAYWSGVRPAAGRELWNRLRRGVVILGYHAFTAGAETPSRYVVSAKAFARQMAWLKRRGYRIISMSDYAAARSTHTLLPAKSVVITIDDGYLDNATIAKPILDRYGFPATVYLISSTDRDGDARQDAQLRNRPLIEPAKAPELLSDTLEIGAHTRTHADLTTLSAAEAQEQIAGSKRDLEHLTGTQITTFAYPFGATSPALRATVQGAGFLAARGTSPGPNRAATNPFDLRRIEVPGTISLLRFARLIELASR